MKLIKLTNGKFAKVDDDDFERLNQINWRFDGRYARTGRSFLMHHFIIGKRKGMDVDHINADKIDNQTLNLRFVTRSFNVQVKGKLSNNTSGFLGVFYKKQIDRFVAQIARNGKLHYLGCFKDKELAAKAYDQKALELFGLDARLNFPLTVATSEADRLQSEPRTPLPSLSVLTPSQSNQETPQLDNP